MKMTVQISEFLKLENQLCFPLYASSRLIIQGYEFALQELRLTYPQYLILLVLWEKDGLSVKEIGEKLLLDSGTLTPVLKKLENLEIIKRHRPDSDNRTVINFLTPRGKKLKEKVAGTVYDLFCKSGIAPDEAVKVRTALQNVAKKLMKLRHVQQSEKA